MAKEKVSEENEGNTLEHVPLMKWECNSYCEETNAFVTKSNYAETL